MNLENLEIGIRLREEPPKVFSLFLPRECEVGKSYAKTPQDLECRERRVAVRITPIRFGGRGRDAGDGKKAPIVVKICSKGVSVRDVAVDVRDGELVQ